MVNVRSDPEKSGIRQAIRARRPGANSRATGIPRLAGLRYDAAGGASMPAIALSDAALALFRLHIEQHGNILIDDSNREPYRELEQAGLMVLGNSYRHGSRTIYRVSKLGFERKAELLGCAKESA
jgi:hypothetical protein